MSPVVLQPEHVTETWVRLNLRVELAWEVLSHSHASRAGLKLLLVEHAVHLTGLAAGGGGAGPACQQHTTVKPLKSTQPFRNISTTINPIASR